MLFAMNPVQLLATDQCARSEELKFMIEGKTLAELLAKVGPGDRVKWAC